MIDEKKLASAAMSNDELDQVAGGSFGGTADDNDFLYKYGLTNKRFYAIGAFFHWKSCSEEVDSGWAKAGITCVTHPSDDNEYFKDGKQITRDEAIAHVKANFPRKNYD